MDMLGGRIRGLQDAESPSTRVQMFMTTSVQTDFHPKHSKLRPRLGARHDTANPTLQSHYQPIYFLHSLLCTRWNNSIRTTHPEATFCGVGVRLDLFVNSLTFLLMHTE